MKEKLPPIYNDLSDQGKWQYHYERKTMKKLKWIVELVKELARGLTQNGRVEILPDDKKED